MGANDAAYARERLDTKGCGRANANVLWQRQYEPCSGSHTTDSDTVKSPFCQPVIKERESQPCQTRDVWHHSGAGRAERRAGTAPDAPWEHTLGSWQIGMETFKNRHRFIFTCHPTQGFFPPRLLICTGLYGLINT